MTAAEKKIKRIFQKKQAEILLAHPKAAGVRRKLEYEVLGKLLPQVGTFYRTNEGALLFYRKGDHKLYDLREEPFFHYLVRLTDEVMVVKQNWLQKLQAEVRFDGLEVETHFLAYNDSADLNVIAVNTFDGYMWRRKRGGKWERVPNGTDGILFLTPMDFLTPWKPKAQSGETGKNLERLCSQGHLEGAGLTVQDQQRLFMVWLLHLFFPAINPVHPILLLQGVTGSGKSVQGELFGRFLTGPEFEVADLPSGDAHKAEESLTLGLYKRPLLVIDNVDSPSPWMEDFVCRVASGVRMSRRRLYTNSEEVHFTPKAGLILTSRDPHFRREDVARRLLPIRFAAIPENKRRTETMLRAEIDARRGRIWGDVLNLIARIQEAWPKLRATLKPTHSLADFEVFGALVMAVTGGNAAEWQKLMQRLGQAQREFSVEEDPLAELLEEALSQRNGAINPQPMRELYQSLRDIADMLGMPWPWKNPGSLTKALKLKKQALEQRLNAWISVTDNHHGGETRVGIQRLEPAPVSSGEDQGGDGDDGGDDSSLSLVEVSAQAA